MAVVALASNEAVLLKEPYCVHQYILDAMRCHPNARLVQVFCCNALANLAWNRTGRVRRSTEADLRNAHLGPLADRLVCEY